MITRATHQLVEFLLAEDNRAAVAARLLNETGAWSEALGLARTWNVTPQVSARIQSLGCALHVTDTGILRRDFLKTYARSSQCVAKAIHAIYSLERAGIPAVAFKGVASTAVLYGDPRRRAMHDADILIRRGDLREALPCLEREGFAREGSETLEQYLQFVENAPRFAGNQAVTLVGENGAEIDLHWELSGSGLDTEDILARAHQVPLLNEMIQVVDSKDGFLLTVHHAIREDLAIENVCRDFLDVRLWCHHLRETGQLEAGMKWAAQSGFQVPALAVTSVLAGYDPAAAAATAAEILTGLASPSERESAKSLTELFHYQLGNGRLGKDVFYLVHSRPWRQILRGLGMDWSGYRQSMKSMEKHLGEELPLYERVALLAKSIPGRQGLKLARELALVKYGVRYRAKYGAN